MQYLDLRLENLNKIINVTYSFRIKCNHKKYNFKYNIHFEDLENSYKTINTIVDLIINFSKNFNKNFNPDIYRIKRLENKVELIGKNLDYIHSLDLIKENRTLGYKIKQLEDANTNIINQLGKLTKINKKQTNLLKEL